jgi:hypothetical protein
MKWEYLVLDWELPLSMIGDEEREYCFCRQGEPWPQASNYTRKTIEGLLNELGQEGWELFHVYDFRKFYLKRSH